MEFIWCSDEQPQRSGNGKGAQPNRQQQLPVAAQSSGQSQHALSKLPSQSSSRADAKQKPSLILQARTGVLPYSGSQAQADMPAGHSMTGGPSQSWYNSTGSAVVREAIKVGLL